EHQGDLPRLGLQALGEEGQQGHHQAEPDQVDEDHGEQDRQGRRPAAGCCLNLHALASPAPGGQKNAPAVRPGRLIVSSPVRDQRGARIMIIWRPSILGANSTLASSSKSAWTLFISFMPSSGWAISRPRKRIVTLTLSPSSKKRCMALAFTS